MWECGKSEEYEILCLTGRQCRGSPSTTESTFGCDEETAAEAFTVAPATKKPYVKLFFEAFDYENALCHADSMGSFTTE